MKDYAFIWDLDGTLLDSYQVIVSSLVETCKEYGIDCAFDAVWEHAVRYSVTSFIQNIARSHSLPAADLQKRYSEISGEKKLEITLMPGAAAVLDTLARQGGQHFVFTHRGQTTMAVLEHLGIAHFFTEILTSQSGFARKPSGEAVEYLVAKYGLDKRRTYYVGDRTLDMECGRNAGIGTILLLVPGTYGQATGIEDHVVSALSEIPNLPL